MRRLEQERGLELERRLRRRLALVDRRARAVLGLDLGPVRGSRLRPVRAGPRAGARCRARAGSRARGSTTPRTCSPARPPDRLAVQHASELRELERAHLGRAARAGGARSASALRGLGVEPGDRVCRLHAEPARDPGRLPRQRLDRRDLVELLAGLRRPLGRRPLRPDRAQGALLRRRLPLQRPRLRPRETSSPGCSRSCRRSSTRSHCATSTPRPRSTAFEERSGSTSSRRAAIRGRSRSSSSPSTTRSGSSTRRGPPGCRRRSSRATAASCSSSSRSITCTSTRSPATACSGSRPRAG